jgi:Zn-dependent protease with chaperone function
LFACARPALTVQVMMTLQTAEPGHAVYYDGRSNRKRRVALDFAEALAIIENGAVVDSWPYDSIRRAEGSERRLRLKCLAALPLARLEIEDAAARHAIEARCPSLDAGQGGSAQTGRIVAWSLAAVGSIIAVALLGIPYAADRLAPLVPLSVEKRIGEAVDGQMGLLLGGKNCQGAAGRAAFAKLIDKLADAGGIAIPLEAEVLSVSLPNAFALPGGKIYVTDGLLQKAQNPDEVAGVVAHELGHVQHRDGLRRIIQTGGTSFLIGLLFGDVMGGSAVIFASRSVLNASYSRDAERAADAFAVETMHRLGRSPKPMGELLMRVTGAQADKTVTILTSHPLTEERLATMQKEDRTATGAELLSAGEWRALRGVCK